MNEKKPKISNENYLVIQGWMVNELKLKGNELLIYAIIYGFTQEENQVFSGSLQYLADWINSTKESVRKCLKSLVDKGLIVKGDEYKNEVKFCWYYAAKGYTTKLVGVYNKVGGGIQQSCINNIEDNIEDNKKKNYKKKSFEKPTLEEIMEYCKRRNNNVNPQKFYDYYDSNDWKDKNGKEVKNWKQKMIANWERETKGKEMSDDGRANRVRGIPRSSTNIGTQL